jgi:WD40 repeat protein
MDQSDDFLLIDVIGGGCKFQSVPNLITSKSVAVMHPNKPIIAYTAGCMIIVYDLLSDSKINLIGHKHDVYAIEFSPGGDTLISIDFDRNAEL